MLDQLLLGVSTRGYDASLPPPLPGTKSRGTSRSSVSRKLVERMTSKMRQELSAALEC